MKRYTLLFDGNFWLMKTFSMCRKLKRGKLNFIDEPEEDRKFLLWKLATDFSAEVRRFEKITNKIVYALDYSSWRKDIKTDQDYKGNRIKSTDIDWDAVYATHNEFVEMISKSGVVVNSLYHAEADDLIYAWSNYLNQNDENSLIISGDNDLLQLVYLDKETKTNTIYYNKFNKNIFTALGFEDILYDTNDDDFDAFDIFDIKLSSIENTSTELSNIIKKDKIELIPVNVNEFVFVKILTGDAGDHVSSLNDVVKETKAGERIYKVTENQANKVLDEIKSKHLVINESMFFNDELIDDICNVCKNKLKIDKDLFDIKGKWKLNRDLVFLHKESLPEDLYNKIISLVEDNFDKFTDVNKLINRNILYENLGLEKNYNPNDDNKAFNNLSYNKVDKNLPEIKVDKNDNNKSFNSSFWDDLLN